MPASSTSKHIFMSYSRRDDAVMRRVLKFLRKQGIKVWLDNEKLIPGTPIWEKEIERAIKNAAAIVVICSPDSNESEWVRREITFAERYRKHIFPLLTSGDEDTSISIRLSTRQFVDIRQNEGTGLNAVSAAISAYLGELERQERVAQEQKATEEKVKKEREERERHERDEKNKKEKEAREKIAAEERARIATAEKAKKATEIRKESPSPARGGGAKGGGKPAWMPYAIGGVVVAAFACLIFGGNYLLKNVFSFPTSIIPSANPTDVAELLGPFATQTAVAQVSSTPTITHDGLGVGSTMVSEKDGMTMVYVPAGEFLMGSENGNEDEKPIHTVYLDSYWIDQTEVTNAMYAKCVEASVCDPPSSTKSYTRDSYYGNAEFDDYPVIYVAWNDAVAYCDWADRRLPNEAEWEKVASWDEDAQAQRLYPWGNEIDGTYANYNQNVRDTTAVGSYGKGASFYGAYDMTGNAWEWASSLYQPYPYSATDGREDLSVSGVRVLRGGSWGYYIPGFHASLRVWNDPSSPSYDLSFRCARSSP